MNTVKLGSICELITRGISPKYTEDEKLGVTVLNQKCIRNKTVLYEFSRLHNLSVKSVNKSKFVKSGDVLINSTGHGTLGRTALAENINEPLLVDSHVTILRPFEGLFEPRYFAYLIGRSENDFIKMATGTSGQTELPRALLNDYEISYEPSIEEQRRIVAKLDAAFEKIDQAIELTEENLLRAKSLYTSARREAIKKLAGNESNFINNIGKNLDNMRVPITKSKRKSGQYPYYGASGIVDYVDNYIFDQVALLISEDGANILARSTPIAFVASGKYWVNNHAHIYSFSDTATLKYVEYYLENTDLKPFITGAAQPKLSQSNLNKIPIFIPPLDIQKKAVNIISEAERNARKLTSLYTDKINHMKALKQSMLTQAFSTTNKV